MYNHNDAMDRPFNSN